MVGLRCFDKKVHWPNIGHENIKTLETFRSGSSVGLEYRLVTPGVAGSSPIHSAT